MNSAKLGQEFNNNLKWQRKESQKLLKAFIEIAELAMSLGGSASFEWPNNSAG